ncbi:MAG: hypothetical protein LBH96_06615 [Candidatus Peribacteria bacterium]|jgi:hypothetical protein|nr:hypothetical protein [Candidatus Peribacteria bacterium]
MLIGEKAGNKKKKAEDYNIRIYEGRETITEIFPILTTITQPSKEQQTSLQSSLF